MMQRAVLLGMNNPLWPDDPEKALWPHPSGCTGHRLWQFLSMRVPVTREQYLDAFERVNMVLGPVWQRRLAEEAAPRLIKRFQGRHVLALGQEVARALDIPPDAPRMLPFPWEGMTVRLIPHPSARSLWYNLEANKVALGMILEEYWVWWWREQQHAGG